MKSHFFSPAVLSASYFFTLISGMHIDISRNGDIGIDLELTHRTDAQHALPSQAEEVIHHTEGDDKDYQIEFEHGTHQGYLSVRGINESAMVSDLEQDDGAFVKFNNIPYAEPPNSSDLRWAPPQPIYERQDGLVRGEGIRKCPQAVPGWVNKSFEFLDEFSSNVLYPLDPKWNEPIGEDQYGEVADPEGEAYAPLRVVLTNLCSRRRGLSVSGYHNPEKNMGREEQ